MATSLLPWRQAFALFDDAKRDSDTALPDALLQCHASLVRTLASFLLVRRPATPAEGALPNAVVASGAGVGACNGRYVRDGQYGGVPRFVHEAGQLWLIRYRLPSGSAYW